MIRALNLDIVRRRSAWPALLVLMIGLAIAADAGLRYERLRDEIAMVQQPVTATRAAHAGAEPISEQTQRELEAARRLLQELVLPWDALFRSIEASVDGDTGLLALEPEADKRAVRITGEARNYRAVLDFILRLEEQPGLTQIHLLNHQIREDVAERPFMFTLAASWGARP
jgi:Tfp pilus assembly protein PilN